MGASKELICARSVFFEKLIEHRFIADVIMYGRYIYDKEMEVLRPEIDSAGYDILIDCENIRRYVQLKTSDNTSKRSYQKVNVSLFRKQNLCIIWLLYSFDRKKKDLHIRYFFWGADIGEGLPSIDEYAIAKTRRRATGTVKSKPNVRSIPKGQFVELEFGDLLTKLFGVAAPDPPQDTKTPPLSQSADAFDCTDVSSPKADGEQLPQ